MDVVDGCAEAGRLRWVLMLMLMGLGVVLG